jgi:hypothetical protein
MGQPSQEKKQWFLTRSGIRKDVLMAEVDGLLGPDTIVRTGSNEGVAGYWITAEQSLDVELVRILKKQTEEWEKEIQKTGNDGKQSLQLSDRALIAFI